MSADARRTRVRALHRERPRSQLLRWTLMIFGLWTLYAWTSPEISIDEFLSKRRLSNLTDFVSGELMPFPLREEGFRWSGLGQWIGEIWRGVGAQSTWLTLQISILAIVLAGACAWPLATLAARNFATSTPFEAQARELSTWKRLGWTATRRLARLLAILMRAVPEYILAFLLLAVLGADSAWPAVLALAIHNAGILGRLGGEVIENLEPAPLQSLTAIGAPRHGLLIFGVLPLTLGRNLLYFFYRFETCVREATVLGMLGVVSLGYWIQDARSKQYYDEMLFLVLCGSVLVILADVLSALARRSIRRG